VEKIHAHHDATVTIDSTHQNAHEGFVWHCFQKNADGAQVADNAEQSFVIDLAAVAADEFLHLTWEAEAGGDAEIQLWEGSTYTGGSAHTPLNMHRGSSHTVPTGLVVTTGATITTTSKVQLDGTWLPGGRGPNSNGGVGRGGTEWILKPGLVYSLHLINRAAAAKDMSLAFIFYED
jgi:hypothetical protein